MSKRAQKDATSSSNLTPGSAVVEPPRKRARGRAFVGCERLVPGHHGLVSWHVDARKGKEDWRIWQAEELCALAYEVLEDSELSRDQVMDAVDEMHRALYGDDESSRNRLSDRFGTTFVPSSPEYVPKSPEYSPTSTSTPSACVS